MRIFLADIGNLIGPLLLVLFAVLPRLLKANKKKQQSRPKPVQPAPAPARVEQVPRQRAEPPPPAPAEDIPELADLGEVLQELLGKRRPEPEPVPEPEFVEYEPPAEEPYERDYYAEPAEAPFEEVPEQTWETYHSLKASQLTGPARVSRSNRHRELLGGRRKLQDAILLKEILGPPRSLQPIEDWGDGGA